jgi:CcdB protein
VKQFDIVENLNPLTRRRFPLAVVLQHDRVSTPAVVVPAPLTTWTSDLASSRLHPSLPVGDGRFVILIEELAGVQRATLGRVVGSAAAERYGIVAAIDLLFTGI